MQISTQRKHLSENTGKFEKVLRAYFGKGINEMIRSIIAEESIN